MEELAPISHMYKKKFCDELKLSVAVCGCLKLSVAVCGCPTMSDGLKLSVAVCVSLVHPKFIYILSFYFFLFFKKGMGEL